MAFWVNPGFKSQFHEPARLTHKFLSDCPRRHAGGGHSLVHVLREDEVGRRAGQRADAADVGGVGDAEAYGFADHPVPRRPGRGLAVGILRDNAEGDSASPRSVGFISCGANGPQRGPQSEAGGGQFGDGRRRTYRRWNGVLALGV